VEEQGLTAKRPQSAKSQKIAKSNKRAKSESLSPQRGEFSINKIENVARSQDAISQI